MGSKANFQQAPVHWPREITKAKLSQVKSFFIHISLSKQWEKRRKGKFGQVWTTLGKFRQVWGKFGQIWASQDNLGQGNILEKWGEKAERVRKGKN